MATYEKYIKEGFFTFDTPQDEIDVEDDSWDSDELMKLKVLLTKIDALENMSIAKRAIKKTMDMDTLTAKEKSFMKDFVHFFLTTPDKTSFRTIMNKF